MYLWVHLRAEEGEEDHFVPPSELVMLPAGHPEHLIPNHHPLDENGCGEAEGLTQDAVCRQKGTVEPLSARVRSPAPSGAICRRTDVYGDPLMKKGPGKGQTFILPVAVPKCRISYSCFTGTASRGYLPKTGVLRKSSESLVRCGRAGSCRLNCLISDLSASMASGLVSRKPRSQKAAGPLLHWKENK